MALAAAAIFRADPERVVGDELPIDLALGATFMMVASRNEDVTHE